MIIVSFNVNGIRARLHQLQAVIDKFQPDVIGLQETKVEDTQFPLHSINQMGYQAVYHGQKGHYGVALLYKQPILASRNGFDQDGEDAQRRLIAITVPSRIGPLTIYNGYFPQGESRKHPTKFPNKRDFYQHLRAHLQDNHRPDEAVVVLGDMNVAPLDKDIGIGEDNRKRWLQTGKCCFLPEERGWLEELTEWGLSDCYELAHPAPGGGRYTWFDYRSRGFERDPRRGLRIDLILGSGPVVKVQKDAGIDQQIRAMEKPSDHCPVWLKLDL